MRESDVFLAVTRHPKYPEMSVEYDGLFVCIDGTITGNGRQDCGNPKNGFARIKCPGSAARKIRRFLRWR